MKVDSGADANIIGTDIFEMIQQKQVKPILLRKTKARLTPFNSVPIKLRGMFTTKISIKGRTVETNVYVA